MPQPTREQFDAASKKVMASAPPGLSREEFYTLIDKELNPPTPTGMREKGLAQGAVTDENGQPIESSFLRELRGRMEGPAHPKTLSDLAPLIIPASIGESGPSVIKLLQAAKKGATEGGSVVRAPWNAVKGAANWANRVPETPVLGPLNRGWKSTIAQPDVPLGAAPSPHFEAPAGAKPTDTAIQSQMHDTLVKGLQDAHPEMPSTMAGPGETVQQDVIPPLHGDPSLVAPGGEAAFNAVQTPIAPMPAHVPTPFSGGAPNMPGTVRPIVDPREATGRPMLSAPEVARKLRETYGAEKAGRMLYGKQTGGLDIIPSAEKTESIRRLASGPSQLPAEAKARIDAYLGKGNDISNQYLLDALTKRMGEK